MSAARMGAGAVKAAVTVTDWFPGHVKPIRKGVYQRMIPRAGAAYWHFDGKYWLYGGGGSPELAISANIKSPEQCLEWRGLAADPAKAGK